MSRTATQNPRPAKLTVRVAENPEEHRGGRTVGLLGRTSILFCATLVAAIAALVVWRIHVSRASAEAFRFETAAVDRGRIVAKVTATGTLSALVTVQVGSQVSGTIATLGVDYNSPVKKGQIIATIDPPLFEAAVEQARANVVAAEGNLARTQAQHVDADRQLQRQRELGERNLAAQADVDTAQTNADAAAASVKASQGALAQARAVLSQAQVKLTYTRIVSPTSGVVISRNVDVGQTVAASLQAPTLFVIAEDLAKMQVDTNVAESDVGRLQAGMPATFTVDAYPYRAFSGKVRQVRNAPQTIQNVVTYDAVVDVANADLALKPGMTATVTFTYAQKQAAVRVPNAALRFRPPPGMPRPDELVNTVAGNAGQNRGPKVSQTAPHATPDQPDGSRVVWVFRDGRPTPLRIKTGITDGTRTELVDGRLEIGELLITDAAGPVSGSSAPHGPRLF